MFCPTWIPASLGFLIMASLGVRKFTGLALTSESQWLSSKSFFYSVTSLSLFRRSWQFFLCYKILKNLVKHSVDVSMTHANKHEVSPRIFSGKASSLLLISTESWWGPVNHTLQLCRPVVQNHPTLHLSQKADKWSESSYFQSVTPPKCLNQQALVLCASNSILLMGIIHFLYSPFLNNMCMALYPWVICNKYLRIESTKFKIYL